MNKKKTYLEIIPPLHTLSFIFPLYWHPWCRSRYRNHRLKFLLDLHCAEMWISTIPWIETLVRSRKACKCLTWGQAPSDNKHNSKKKKKRNTGCTNISYFKHLNSSNDIRSGIRVLQNQGHTLNLNLKLCDSDNYWLSSILYTQKRKSKGGAIAIIFVAVPAFWSPNQGFASWQFTMNKCTSTPAPFFCFHQLLSKTSKIFHFRALNLSLSQISHSFRNPSWQRKLEWEQSRS